MNDPVLTRSDIANPAPILDRTSEKVSGLLPLIDAAASLGLDVELTTEYRQNPDSITSTPVRRWRLVVSPQLDRADACEVLASIALQQQKSEARLAELERDLKGVSSLDSTGLGQATNA